MKPVVLITIGDFNGIGPEVALKAAKDPSVRRLCTPVLVGPLNVFAHEAKLLRIPARLARTSLPAIASSGIPVVDVGDGIGADVAFGGTTRASGRSAGIAIQKAVEHCMQKHAAAVVTAPASKEGIRLAGYDFPGQTEMVAILSGSRRVAMMLIANRLRVGLVTIHSPLRNVASQISVEKILEKATIILESLRNDFAIQSPRLALLGLNPHAGENGVLGSEEREIIAPAIDKLRQAQWNVSGPFPADGFFGSHAERSYDAVLAMYHDQGLIPLKMAGFANGVNYSAGLPIIRTSPDHGTAFDIAGRNKADIRSMLAAISLAVSIHRARTSHD